MKCRACPKVAVVQVTEVLGEDRFEVLYFCKECGNRYLTTPQPDDPAAADLDPDDFSDLFAADPDASADDLPAEIDTDAELAGQPCEVCGVKFVEFRNSGRLGCPHDYDHFREELLPLLESIHGDTAHAGKVPKDPARPAATRPADVGDLTSLKHKLSRAVKAEDYEAAAKLRDRIREIGGQ